jgi:hypothetical protein
MNSSASGYRNRIQKKINNNRGLDDDLHDILVPLGVGAGQVAKDAAEGHPQREDGLTDVGSELSVSCIMFTTYVPW